MGVVIKDYAGKARGLDRDIRRRRCQGVFAVAALIVCAVVASAGSSPAEAQDAPTDAAPADAERVETEGRAELQGAFIAALPRESLETYPIHFSVAGVSFVFPRNYISTMDRWAGGPQGLVTLRLTLPELKPANAETLTCFTRRQDSSGRSCDRFDVLLSQASNLSDRQRFDNVVGNSGLPIRRMADESGFQVYKISSGDDDAGIYMYGKATSDGFFYFDCSVSIEPNIGQLSLCHSAESYGDGTAVQFYFNGSVLPDITDTAHLLKEIVTTHKE